MVKFRFFAICSIVITLAAACSQPTNTSSSTEVQRSLVQNNYIASDIGYSAFQTAGQLNPNTGTLGQAQLGPNTSSTGVSSVQFTISVPQGQKELLTFSYNVQNNNSTSDGLFVYVTSSLQSNVQVVAQTVSSSTQTTYETVLSPGNYTYTIEWLTPESSSAPGSALISTIQVYNLLPLYQWYSSGSGHYYSTDLGSASAPTWTYQGVAAYVFSSDSTKGRYIPGAIPLYQWAASSSGIHYYSVNYSSASGPYWTYQGIACYVYAGSDPVVNTPFYQWCASSSGYHYYSTNYNSASAPYWTYQGVSCYVTGIN